MSNISKKVAGIIAKNLGIEESKVTPSSHLVNDLGADSLDVVEIIMKIEEEFTINGPQDWQSHPGQVKDIVGYVEARV